MIETASYYIGNSLNPYLNLSIEEYLLGHGTTWTDDSVSMAERTYRCNRQKPKCLEGMPLSGTGTGWRASCPPGFPVEVPYSTIQGISTSPFLFLPKIMTFPVRCRSFWRRCAVLELTHRNPAVTTSPLMEKSFPAMHSAKKAKTPIIMEL